MKNLPLYRIIRIVFMSVKFFLQVASFKRIHKGNWTRETEEKWEKLVIKQAREYKETALKLEGLMIKLGQFLSTRADIMPRGFLQELDDLTDRVPAVPWEKAKKVLEDEWNTSYGDYIHKISERPVASASIGEVYHAYLHTGESVAIKIQRPGIEKIILTDFKAIKIVLWLAKRFTLFGKQTDLDKLYKEMTITIGDELNFRKELQNGRLFSKRFTEFDYVTVPSYYEEFTTRRVLVMEWIEGSKITDLSFLDKHHLDRQLLVKRLLRIFLEQLLKEGLFHADPHGGNILVKQDGTIVLIDFGMVGSINKKDAAAVQRVVEGILFERYEEVVNALEDLRFLLPHADKNALTDVIRKLVDAYKSMEFMNADSLVMDQLLKDIQDIVQKEPVQLPSEFAFFGRAISIFTGVTYILDQDADLFEMSKPIIMEWISSRNDGEGEKSSALLSAVQHYIKPLLQFPFKLQDALEEPTRYRQWRQKDKSKERSFTALLAQRREMAMLFVIPFIALQISIFFEKILFISIFASISIVFGFAYIRVSKKIKKLLEEGDS